VPPPTAPLRTPKKDNGDSLVNYDGRSENIILKLMRLGTSCIELGPSDGQSEAISRWSYIWRWHQRGKIV